MKKLWCVAVIVVGMTWTACAQDNYSSWSYYRNIVLNTKASGANVGTTGSPAMTHFPVLVRLSGHISNGGNANDSTVMAQSAFSSTNGADIRFSKWDGTHLYYQRQRWDAANMYAEFWVLVDTIWGGDSVNATNYPGGYLRMYWGNGSAGDSTNSPMVFDTTATPPTGTAGTLWGGGYQAVYHLTDTTDATWNGKTYPQYYNLTRASTTLVKNTTGMVGLGDTLTGAANSWLVTASKSASPDKLNFQNGGPFTASAWVYDTKNNAGDIIIGSGDFTYQLQLNGSNEWEVGDFASGVAWEFCENTTAPSVNAWYHVVGVRNKIGTSPAYTDSLYVNDVLISTTMSSYATTTVRPAINPNLCVGTDSSTAHKEWYGIIDEAELSSVARGHTWVKLCYENQHQVNASGVQSLGSALDSLTIRGPDFGTAPTISSYSANPATYVTGTPITPNTPTLTGAPPFTFTASPSLPAGLSLNSSNGVITGAASSSQNQQSYTVTLQNSAGSASIGLAIAVNNSPPVIAGQPVNTTVAEGANAKFIVTVVGTPPMQYSWKDNYNNTVKNDTTMNVSDTLIIPNDSAKNSGASYTCTITSGLGSVGPTAAAFLYVAIAPALASPTNGSLGIAQSPILSWNTVTGATMYYLQVSTSAAFGVNAIFDSSAAPSKTETVAPGTLYYWRVQSRLNGVGSLWSNSGGSPWQFTTVPAAPALNSPGNTAVEVAVNPTMSWNTVASATKYWIQITTDGTFTTIGISDSSPAVGSYSPSGLINGTTYYWRVAATNGGGAWGAWSAPWSFYTTENYGVWNGSRTFGLNTQATGANVAKTLYGFPVLLRLSSADVANMTGVQSNGADIRFAKLDGLTHLPYQIESFGPSGGLIWVKMDSVQGGTNNGGFIMKWGNATAPSNSRGSVVFDTTAANPGGGYQAVWHMTDTTDATINGYRLTGTVKPATTAGGIIGACDSFNGSTQYLHTDSLSTYNGKLNFGYQSNFTISAWAFFTAAALSTSGEICTKGDNQYTFQLYNSNWEFTQYQVTSGWWYVNATPTANVWHHVVGVSSASVPVESLYVDGVFKSATMGNSTSTAARVTTNPVYIGSFAGGGSRWFTGKLDEIEMANVARSSAWIKLSYENQQASDSLTYRTAPVSVTYRSSTLNLTMLSAMTPDTPVTVTGVVSQYSVSPPLPSGLSLNALTGIISGTPASASGATGYVITASNPIGSVQTSITISVAYATPNAPVLVLPADNAVNVALTPKLSWNGNAGATGYRVQVSKSASFTPPVIDSSLSATSYLITAALSGNTLYYWRVNASNPAGFSAWATDSFTTALNSVVAIGVKNGWNIISLNIHAQDSLTADVIGALKGFVLAKTLMQFYWPAQGLDGFDTLHTTQGYQMFCDSADTIHASGIPVNVAATPIPMAAGWNMIAYLPQAAIGVDTATAGIAAQLVLVKNSAGQIYWPDTNYNLNSIGEMQPGQGYQVYMTAAAALTYPSGSKAKRLALGKGKNVYLPAPKHFALALNTGSNATIVSRHVGINGAIAPDSSEVGVFDGKGDLVGAGVVMRGAAAFSVWGRSELLKGVAGLGASELMSFKLWNGKREYPLEFHGSAPAVYAKDAIYVGNFVVPSALFIDRFALANAYPNPFRENVRIYFDVPAAAGNAPQEVRIDVYDLRGSVVARLAEGKFNAGHYSVAWDGGNASALGSNMYIVEMKANNFSKKMKLFRVR